MMLKYPNIPVSFNLMAKPVGALCNLDCNYCFYRGKMCMYENSPYMMKEEVLEEYVKQYIGSQASPVVVFNWQGGEPTLAGPAFYEHALYLQKKYAGNKKIENSIQTNGTLLDESWCRFLKRHHFRVGISIDGPREIHDYHRRGVGQTSTWEKVMRGINLLRDHGVPFHTMTAITHHSARYPLLIYEFLKELGSGYQHYAPVVERYHEHKATLEPELAAPDVRIGAAITTWSVTPESYGEFMVTIFNEWVRNDVGKVFVELFEITLANWLGEDPGFCQYRKYCGNALMMEQNGDVYACEHYVFPEYLRGNIMDDPLMEVALSQEQAGFGFNKHDALPSMCRACEFLFACHGECPKNRIRVTPGGEYGLNYLCPGYRLFFSHVSPFMDHMASQIRHGKSPLSVKKIARKRLLPG
jgi:uncharacterized protein